jgi:very-short-patch-repair endonuclease
LVQKIVIGQKVSQPLVEQAKALRKRMTEEERTLWQALRGNRLKGLHFRRQQLIDSFIVDFYCHAAALVVEVDGGIHVTQVDYDAERDSILESRGLNIIRISNEKVRNNLDAVLATIATATKVEK